MVQHAHPPLSLYIHIPWCVRKCPYCDFNSHARAVTLADEARYVDSLLHDLDYEAPAAAQRSVQSVFFGGGTPSLFSAASIARVLDAVAHRLKLDSQAEITLEANPGAVDEDHFNGYRQAGVNRLSIGIQSFDDDCLEAIGRVHNAAQALHACSTARDAGFDNINLDLMFGLPGQSPQQAERDVQTACELDAQHISHYHLTIEANTLFSKYPPVLPDAETAWRMQDRCYERLYASGYSHYEVSALARPGYQSRHNLNYWSFGDYIGIGAGAHGKLTGNDGTVTRRWKRRQPEDYMQHAADGAVSGEQVLDNNDIVFEFLLNSLRLKQGCSFETFEKHTGLEAAILKQYCTGVDSELLVMDDYGVSTSDRGFLFLNDVMQQLMKSEK